MHYFKMMSKSDKIRKNSLKLLDKFFKETSKEELEKLIKKYDDMNFEGPTFDEYLKTLKNMKT